MLTKLQPDAAKEFSLLRTNSKKEEGTDVLVVANSDAHCARPLRNC
jgi:hypothetical protein